MKGSSTKRVKVVDYESAWAETFADLSRVLGAALGELALAIEHVGSTSVPGLAAKSIIDIDVVIESPALLTSAIDALRAIGYFHEGDLGIAGREAFGRDDLTVPRDGSGHEWPDHHLYVCAQDSIELRRHLAFRDHLRSHPDYAAEYAELKRSLADLYPRDIDSYIEGKREFIERILVDSGI